MNPNLDNATHGEITLVDCVRISGILIFVALICLCIGLLAAGAKRSATIPAQEAITSVFTETTHSKPNEKAHVRIDLEFLFEGPVPWDREPNHQTKLFHFFK